MPDVPGAVAAATSACTAQHAPSLPGCGIGQHVHLRPQHARRYNTLCTPYTSHEAMTQTPHCRAPQLLHPSTVITELLEVLPGDRAAHADTDHIAQACYMMYRTAGMADSTTASAFRSAPITRPTQKNEAKQQEAAEVPDVQQVEQQGQHVGAAAAVQAHPAVQQVLEEQKD